MIIESGLANAKQVIVTGCARLDLAFGYKNTEIGNSTILYYMIEKERSIPGRKHFVSWSNLKLETENYFLGNKISLVDVALMPFIRQTAYVNLSWFTEEFSTSSTRMATTS